MKIYVYPKRIKQILRRMTRINNDIFHTIG